ncbi:glycolate oxidase subunit GlcE [Thiocapsa bogorovii]|uniref:glycolate oxidase subunit GlcE n=1 Tax=Thiocapsa bogorovii TaxID=521689 RepID=UPI001E3BE032|nr:glycolate oxidase subunit GlcE [Thiocapsa bogorovii]UHD18179.1 glycolate oxidase subunit GlcE [Thiocapsa bogorovii]
MSNDLTAELQDRVRAAADASLPLRLEGNGTKSALGRAVDGEGLSLSGHTGILNYQPKELVVTARCGTPLCEIEAALSEQGQMLPFEPPHFADDSDGDNSTLGATLGGTIACGLSGPARPYAGSARDLVLGTRVLTGRAEILRFGGEVMKNVAGYDISRLMTGAYGTLGILLDISVKVLPISTTVRTLVQTCSQPEAIHRMTGWAAKPLPISATCFDGERLWVRLSGNQGGVSAAAERIGGESVDEGEALVFWRDQIREQRHPFFADDAPLWRLSVPPAVPPLSLPGVQLIEWGGAQRWLRSDAAADIIRAATTSVGGHATLFRGGDRRSEVFHPLPAGLMTLHREMKRAFDPNGILNPGRLYPTL